MAKTVIKKKEKQAAQNKIILIVLISLLLSNIVLISILISNKNQTCNTVPETIATVSQKQKETEIVEKEPEVNMLNSSIKHGKFTFVSEISEKQNGEFWFDGSRYRLTWYEDNGDVRLHMINTDGKNLYYSRPEEETSEIAYVAPRMHFSIFGEPPEYLSKEEYEEDGYQVTKYEIDALWDIEGADQQFYLKDVTIYQKDGQIKKTVSRTKSQKVAEEDLVTSTYEFSDVEFPKTLDQELFNLPYPLVN